MTPNCINYIFLLKIKLKYVSLLQMEDFLKSHHSVLFTLIQSHNCLLSICETAGATRVNNTVPKALSLRGFLWGGQQQTITRRSVNKIHTVLALTWEEGCVELEEAEGTNLCRTGGQNRPLRSSLWAKGRKSCRCVMKEGANRA